MHNGRSALPSKKVQIWCQIALAYTPDLKPSTHDHKLPKLSSEAPNSQTPMPNQPNKVQPGNCAAAGPISARRWSFAGRRGRAPSFLRSTCKNAHQQKSTDRANEYEETELSSISSRRTEKQLSSLCQQKWSRKSHAVRDQHGSNNKLFRTTRPSYCRTCWIASLRFGTALGFCLVLN